MSETDPKRLLNELGRNFGNFWDERKSQIKRQEQEQKATHEEIQREARLIGQQIEERIQLGKDHWPQISKGVSSFLHDINTEVLENRGEIQPWKSRTNRESRYIFGSEDSKYGGSPTIGTSKIVETYEETFLRLDGLLTLHYKIEWTHTSTDKYYYNKSENSPLKIAPQTMWTTINGELVDKYKNSIKRGSYFDYPLGKSPFHWSLGLELNPNEFSDKNNERVIFALSLIIPDKSAS